MFVRWPVSGLRVPHGGETLPACAFTLDTWVPRPFLMVLMSNLNARTRILVKKLGPKFRNCVWFRGIVHHAMLWTVLFVHRPLFFGLLGCWSLCANANGGILGLLIKACHG
ncbi:hypothetical protein BJ322DRAFT_1085629 [Thelephora terrestris]|uniref:Uncharacterized protein n=1 Tax=Thelephora terrestris TaxID=56493 RepID=A0A9P6H6W5_9AGAM|nr:hypothetical protein BJ322DRAFT_1085629 [Thelephora terrestris]